MLTITAKHLDRDMLPVSSIPLMRLLSSFQPLPGPLLILLPQPELSS